MYCNGSLLLPLHLAINRNRILDDISTRGNVDACSRASRAILYYNRWFPSIFLYFTLVSFFLLLLFLLVFYISPFFFYIGLGSKAVLFFFCFFYLFLQYIFPTLGLLVCSPIKYPRVLLQSIQACFNILYNIKIIFFYALYIAVALIYSYRGGILVSFLNSTMAVYLYLLVIL